jgi:hypothetical protein
LPRLPLPDERAGVETQTCFLASHSLHLFWRGPLAPTYPSSSYQTVAAAKNGKRRPIMYHGF